MVFSFPDVCRCYLLSLALGHHGQLDAAVARKERLGRCSDVGRRQRTVAAEVLVEPIRVAGLGVVGVQLIAFAAEAAHSFHSVVERRLDLVQRSLELVRRGTLLLELRDLLVDDFLHLVGGVAGARRHRDLEVRRQLA